LKNRKTYLLILTCILFGCSPQTNSDKVVNVQNQVDDKPTNKKLLDNLKIPKSWTEITLIDSVWTYSIPCHRDREVQKIDLTMVDNQEAIMFDWGTAGQWHALKKISTQGDSIIFETVLPYDTTSLVLFTLKYLDKEKNIVRWGADGTYCTYIATQDTSKYTKIQQPCNEEEK
jgi:hypothetical protein